MMWRAIYAFLTVAFIATAALNLLHVHAGFLTNYGSDLVVPAWLYVAVRGLASHRAKRFLGTSPELAAAAIFAASTVTELCQRWWPHGVFRGHYDPFDIVAFGAGIAVCYVLDRVSLRRTVALAAMLALVACSRVQTAPTPAAPKPAAASPETVVKEFGQRLKNVSLTASPDVAGAAIREQYAQFVTPSLLEKWASAPSSAPGRQVSSPWPDRIEITDRQQSANTATTKGELIEATSTGDTRRIPVEIHLQNVGGKWLIASYAERDEDDPVAVVRAYYDAINARAFDKAYASWGSSGPPDQTLDAFARGFADTESVTIETGTPSRIEGAAGSHYVEVPVTIVAKTKSGDVQRFEGVYTLRRSVVDGAPAADRAWHLYRATIRKR